MSIKVMTHVWENSKQQGSTLVVLLAIADFADDQGTAYPSVDTLSKKARVSERNTRYIIAKLQEEGELIVEKNAGPHRANLYRVQSLQGATHSTLRVQPVSAEGATSCPQTIIEPSYNGPSGQPSGDSEAKASPSPEVDNNNVPQWATILSSDPRWKAPESGYLQALDAKYSPDLDLTFEAHRCLHWLQTNIKGKRKKDLLTTWDNWLKNALENPTRKVKANGSPPQPTIEELNAHRVQQKIWLAERRAQIEAKP